MHTGGWRFFFPIEHDGKEIHRAAFFPHTRHDDGDFGGMVEERLCDLASSSLVGISSLEVFGYIMTGLQNKNSLGGEPKQTMMLDSRRRNGR